MAGSFINGDRNFTLTGTPSGPFQSEFKKGGKVGFRFGVDLADHWASEASYSFGANDFRIIQTINCLPELPVNPGGVYYPATGAVHNWEIAVGALFYFR